MSNALQWLLIAPFLLWSLWRVWGKVLPRSRQKMQWALVALLTRLHLTTLARRLHPLPLRTAPCGSGCGGCDTGCSVPEARPQPVRWR